MHALVRALLTADELGSPPYVASGTLFLLAVLAGVTSVRHWRQGRTPTESSPLRPRASRWLLLVLGPIVFCAAYVASGYGAMPAMRALIWPAVRAIEGWPDAWEFDAVWPLEELLAGSITASIFVLASGWLVAKARRILPLDGYWLANPVTIVVGHVLCALAFRVGYEFAHWNGTMWLLRVVVLCPVYAWLFYAGNAGIPRGGRTSG